MCDDASRSPKDRPAKDDTGKKIADAGVRDWNIKVSDRDRLPSTETAEHGPSKPLGRDTTRSVNQLEKALGDSIGAPGWLRPKEIELRDGSKGRIPEGDEQKIRNMVHEEGLGTKTFDRATRVGDVVLFRDPESLVARYTTIGDIPQGASIQNNNFVYRQGSEIKSKPKYPETSSAVARDIRQRTGQPLIDSLGRSLPDKAPVDSEVNTNQKLNGWMKEYLRQGHSLERASHMTADRALHELKMKIIKEVLPLVGP